MSDTDHTLMIQQNTMLMQQLEEVLHILRKMQQSAAVEQDKYQEYLKLSEYYATTDIEKAKLYLELAREVKEQTAPVVREYNPLYKTMP